MLSLNIFIRVLEQPDNTILKRKPTRLAFMLCCRCAAALLLPPAVHSIRHSKVSDAPATDDGKTEIFQRQTWASIVVIPGQWQCLQHTNLQIVWQVRQSELRPHRLLWDESLHAQIQANLVMCLMAGCRCAGWCRRIKENPSSGVLVSSYPRKALAEDQAIRC